MKYIKPLIIILGLILLGFAGYQGYLYFGRGTLSISAKPGDASIVVDNKNYTTQTALDITLAPGKHRVIVALDGYKTIDQEVVMGWQETQSISYKLTLKSFEDIYKSVDNGIDLSEYEFVQEKSFINDTWVAGYVAPANQDEGDVSVLVMKRSAGKWHIVIHSDSLPEDADQQMPAEVYNYIKDFSVE